MREILDDNGGTSIPRPTSIYSVLIGGLSRAASCSLDVGQAGRQIQTNLGACLLAFVILWRDGEFGSPVDSV